MLWDAFAELKDPVNAAAVHPIDHLWQAEISVSVAELMLPLQHQFRKIWSTVAILQDG